MSPGNRPFFPVIPRIFMLLLFFTCNDSRSHNSSPTSSCHHSCGNIRRIRYPFRLKTDPSSCGYNDTHFELDCQNNRTVMNPRSKSWYYVQEIDYQAQTVRVVVPGINRENISSCPLHNSDRHDDWLSSSIFHGFLTLNVPVAFIHCLSPMTSLRYMKAPFCGNRDNIFGNSSEFHMYSYVMFGELGEDLRVRDLEESCTVDRVTWVSVLGLVMKYNSSLASIYDSLAYGFEVPWFQGRCLSIFHLMDKICCPEGPFKCLLSRGLVIFAVVMNYVAWLLDLRFGLESVVGYILLIWLVVHKWRKRHLSMDKTIEAFLQGQHNLMPIKYTYSEIKKMTNNFAQKLGEGGYGIVYKGKLRSGPYVAIKIMEESIANEEEFINEVGTIGMIHHVNVVKLIGFCVQRSKYALVYEFLSNGSLDRYIFNQQSLDIIALTFEKMFEIALGVARGIGYLHHGCNIQILHFDIKPHNILLDEKFNPKISDFGLARLHPTNDSGIHLTAARGTMGYMAPEMFYKNIGHVSYKADVYSYGMMLMEMASRRKNMNPFVKDTGQMHFPSWIYEQLCAGNDIDVNDATQEERLMVKKIIIVALWCIQMRPSDRPPMNKVVEMLEGDLEPRMPPNPFVAPHETAAHDHIITPAYYVDYISSDLAEN